MRVFLAGATGVIGRRLLPLLLAEGHEVTGMTRSAGRVEQLRAAGAEAVVADAFDAEELERVVAEARPDAVIHQLTSIPPRIDPRKMQRDFATNDRLRREGTANLIAAAKAAGVSRLIAQSVAFFYAPGPPGTVHVEQDPLLREAQAPTPVKRSAEALVALERSVLDAGGTVLRYGYFYGPGSAISREGSTGREVARGRLPIVGSGAGVWSFIHVDDAADATVAAIEHGSRGVYNVVDDDPAPVAEWLPAIAQELGVKKPMHVPRFVGRLFAGEAGVVMMTDIRGASNAKAKRELAWSPAHPSWRQGFAAA